MRLRATALAAFALALAAAGCADVSGLQPKVPPSASGGFVDARAGTTTTAAVPDDWWKLFDDTTLDALVARALVVNRDLAIAAANLAQVRASLHAAQSQLLPSTNVQGSATYGRQSAEALGLPAPLPDAWTYDAGISASYEVDLFGRVRSAVRAARADTDAAQAALDGVKVSVAAETARAYADTCADNTKIAVAEHSLMLAQQTVDLTHNLFDAGRGNGLDVARAEALLAQTSAALPTLRAAREEAVFRLGVLLDRTPAEAGAEARACMAIPTVHAPIPVGDGAALLARRPDVRQADRQLAAAAARVGVATAALYPQVSLGGSFGSTATRFGDLGSSQALRFSVGPLIGWSFPNILAARAQLESAKAGGAGALANFDKTVLSALKDTETALSAYAQELDRHAALVTARDRSKTASDLAQQRFEAGEDSFLTVLDAERTLDSAEAALADSDADLTTDQVTLFKALGGGWRAAPAAAAS